MSQTRRASFFGEIIESCSHLYTEFTDHLSGPGLSCCSSNRTRVRGSSPGRGNKKVVFLESSESQKDLPTLGILRLDYDYPPLPGDIDSPETFKYQVHYRVVPGLTFEMCKSGRMAAQVEDDFIAAISWLDAKGVSGITGDCSFMVHFQSLARSYTDKPVFLSPLVQLPAVLSALKGDEQIAVFAGNGKALEPLYQMIMRDCGLEAQRYRCVIVGCEDVPGFQAIGMGEKVRGVSVAPGIGAKAIHVQRRHPKVKAFLMECTELPAYSDMVREATNLPVFDAVTCADFFMNGFAGEKLSRAVHCQLPGSSRSKSPLPFHPGQNLNARQRSRMVSQSTLEEAVRSMERMQSAADSTAESSHLEENTDG